MDVAGFTAGGSGGLPEEVARVGVPGREAGLLGTDCMSRRQEALGLGLNCSYDSSADTWTRHLVVE